MLAHIPTEDKNTSLTPEFIRIRINHNVILAQQMRPQYRNVLFFRRQDPKHTKRIPIYSLLGTILIPRQSNFTPADVEHQVRQLRSSSAVDRSTSEDAVRFGSEGFVYLFGGFGGQADGWVKV